MSFFGAGMGAGWLWLALVPVSGWLSLQSRFLRRFFWDASGHQRYFLIVLAGLLNALAGFAVSYCAVALFSAAHAFVSWAEFWNLLLEIGAGTADANAAYAPLKSAFFWSAPGALLFAALLFGGAFVCISKQKIDNQRMNYLAKKNGLFNFVDDASEKCSLAIFTLSNHKVYVGWPIELSDRNNPEPPRQYVYVLPLMSGFRRADSLELVITTNYLKPYRDFLRENAEVNEEELAVLLPAHEIVHAQPFDPEIYRKGGF